MIISYQQISKDELIIVAKNPQMWFEDLIDMGVKVRMLPITLSFDPASDIDVSDFGNEGFALMLKDAIYQACCEYMITPTPETERRLKEITCGLCRRKGTITFRTGEAVRIYRDKNLNTKEWKQFKQDLADYLVCYHHIESEEVYGKQNGSLIN